MSGIRITDYDEDGDEYREYIRLGNGKEYADCLYQLPDDHSTPGIPSRLTEDGMIYHVGRILRLLRIKAGMDWHEVAFLRRFSVDSSASNDRTGLWTLILTNTILVVPIHHEVIIRPAQLLQKYDTNMKKIKGHFYLNSHIDKDYNSRIVPRKEQSAQEIRRESSGSEEDNSADENYGRRHVKRRK